MLLGWLGRSFQLLARFAPEEARADLRHVGEELVRLDRRRAQGRATSR